MKDESAKGVREVEAILRRAVDAGGGHLDEHDSLRVLALRGMPVAGFALAGDAAEAVAAARRIGYPVVLKGVLPGVAHKTEKGLVHPWVRSPAELEAIVGRLRTAGCAACLVAEHVPGIRELVLGVVRDPLLGPAVVAAMGGVHSELIDDSVSVLAPVGEEQALRALGRLRCARMLGRYRGEEPARLGELAALMGLLGRIALEFPSIKELDINPLILRRDGTPVVCSGLIVV